VSLQFKIKRVILFKAFSQRSTIGMGYPAACVDSRRMVETIAIDITSGICLIVCMLITVHDLLLAEDAFHAHQNTMYQSCMEQQRKTMSPKVAVANLLCKIFHLF
jgi:hypothetical protein